MRRILTHTARASGHFYLLVLAALVALAVASSAQRTPFPDPQDLIDVASPGDTVQISHSGNGHVTIDKPLTIVGDHMTTLRTLTLDGPGSGNVNVVGFDFVDGVKGGGFDSLRLVRCSFDCPVRVDGAEYVEVTKSRFLHYTASLTAVGADVILTDCRTAPTTPDPVVTCANLYLSGTPQTGLYDVQSLHELPVDLTISKPDLHVGASATLSWSVPSRYAFLYGSFGSHAPKPIPSSGAFSSLIEGEAQLYAIGASNGSFALDVPVDSSLIGKVLAFQVWGRPRYYSRPVFLLIH